MSETFFEMFGFERKPKLITLLSPTPEGLATTFIERLSNFYHTGDGIYFVGRIIKTKHLELMAAVDPQKKRKFGFFIKDPKYSILDALDDPRKYVEVILAYPNPHGVHPSLGKVILLEPVADPSSLSTFANLAYSARQEAEQWRQAYEKLNKEFAEFRKRISDSYLKLIELIHAGAIEEVEALSNVMNVNLDDVIKKARSEAFKAAYMSHLIKSKEELEKEKKRQGEFPEKISETSIELPEAGEFAKLSKKDQNLLRRLIRRLKGE